MEMIDVTALDGSPAEVTVDRVGVTILLGIRTPDTEHRLVPLTPRELLQLRSALDRAWEQVKTELAPSDWRDLLDVV